MTKLYVVVLLALAAAAVSARSSLSSGSICTLNQEEIKKDVMECMILEPELMLQVAGHMQNPESMVTSEFICNNQKAVVNILMCMEEKLASCYESAKTMILQNLPNHDRWQDAVQFMCQHKDSMLATNCMDQNQLQQFMQCYMGKLVGIMQAVKGDHDMKSAVCSVIQSEEQCIQTFHGSCSQSYVSLIIQLLDKLFPSCQGLPNNTDNQKLRDALGDLLLRGEPLKFQPQGNNVPYNIIKAN